MNTTTNSQQPTAARGTLRVQITDRAGLAQWAAHLCERRQYGAERTAAVLKAIYSGTDAEAGAAFDAEFGDFVTRA